MKETDLRRLDESDRKSFLEKMESARVEKEGKLGSSQKYPRTLEYAMLLVIPHLMFLFWNY